MNDKLVNNLIFYEVTRRLFIENIIVFFIFFSDSGGLNVVFSPCCCVTEQAKGSDTPLHRLLYLLSHSIAHLAEDAVNTSLTGINLNQTEINLLWQGNTATTGLGAET